jgi:hypothetical protein
MLNSGSTDPSVSFDRVSAGMFVSGIILPIVAKAVAPGLWSNTLCVVALLCWFVLPLWYPYCAIRTGVIGARYGVFRKKEPFRFWVGLATYEVLLLVLSIVMALAVYAGFMKD